MQPALQRKPCRVCSWKVGWETGGRGQGAEQFPADGPAGVDYEPSLIWALLGASGASEVLDGRPRGSPQFFLTVRGPSSAQQEAVGATSMRRISEQCSVAVMRSMDSGAAGLGLTLSSAHSLTPL